MLNEVQIGDLVRQALEVMREMPKPLAETVEFMAQLSDLNFSEPLKWLVISLPSADTNSVVFRTLGIALRKWDRAEQGNWIGGTSPFTNERRNQIYKLLGLPVDLHSILDKRMPVFNESDQPILIAETHEEWYAGRLVKVGFYWKAYSSYLQSVKNWDDDAIAKLDQSTDEVVRRLSNPSRKEVFQSKGLVVGYVQSGKTANFSGVLAKSADAGYRFIIVLAGTLDILRAQTQRRVDKELVGKELLKEDYASDPDWEEFLSHGGVPSELGSFDWERLTGPEQDYRELKHAFTALEFKSALSSKPYHDPENLRRSPLRIIVIKKVPKVMIRLARDLAKIRSRLADVPTLIIDDESDQASINTIDPDKEKKESEKARTATNAEIVKLLNILPRAQYLGYTATPFANVFVDPNDAEDLFPKDFIISLPRPKGYMGVADFYDFDSEPEGFDSNEKAFIRNVRGDDCGGDVIDGKENPHHLQNAIDSFVLAGAIKLFRQHQSGGKLKYIHHTMLVHHSVSKADHDSLAEKVSTTFGSAGYHGGNGVARLKALFDDDFVLVSRAKGKGLPMPMSFAELSPFVAECLQKLSLQKTVLIVNGDNKDDTPDFDKGAVWAILVGGTKLSRGYTVEGLTTTYFRRVSTTTDTLMQMGRWFGYRRGFGDLVRLFIGREERFGSSGKKKLDLYEAFRAICQDEEKFRQELIKYKNDGITPKQVPPLVPSHLTMLRPTAKNKMYNSYIKFKNFGGEWSEPTSAPIEKASAEHNETLAVQLLSRTNFVKKEFSGKKTGKEGQLDNVNVNALCGIVATSDLVAFVKGYRWNGDKQFIIHEIEFLEGAEGDPEINDWLVMAPLITQTEKGSWPAKLTMGIPQIPIQLRSRIGDRFKVYTTSSHRAVAEYISCVSSRFQPTVDTSTALRNPHRGVMLLYPIKSDDSDSIVSIGFALLFPKNKLENKIRYSVKDKSRPHEVIVPLESD